MSRPSPMHVAVIGTGRMGRHHARTYASMPEAKLVGIVDTDADRAEQTVEDFGGRAYADAEALLKDQPELKAVSVAVPTKYHFAAARPFLERGIACLIEKPLAPTADEARELAASAEKHDAVLQVGHTERFNPAVRAVLDLAFPPRFMEVIRVSPMTFRSLDVGVTMDLMIHDLDIVLTLAGSKPKQVDATGVALLGEQEDVANARIVFENGCVANLTASRLALKVERRLRLFSEAGYVSLDYQKKYGLVIESSGSNEAALRGVREQLAAGADLSNLDYADLVNVKELSMDASGTQADPLTAELTSFLKAAAGEHAPEVDAQAGIAAVDAAERVIQAITAHRWEGLTYTGLATPH